MEFQINRETLLKPLQLVAGVVERRQTLPILANVLLKVKGQELVLVGTDLEVEWQGRVALEQKAEAGAITVPARKLMDICRTLPEQALLEFSFEEPKLIIRSGRSRFSLATLPAAEYPSTAETLGQLEFIVSQQELHQLIERTQFAMAQQDVRFYLNGMLWEVADNLLRMVATDGHRMALSVISTNATGGAQVIVPRKAVLELSRLLTDATGDVVVMLGDNQLRVKADDYTFTSKLIDGRFPDYDKVIPLGGDKILQVDRDILKQALNRVAILANEKHRSVRFEIKEGLLRIAANNPEQEEAEEELAVDYQGSDLEIGFNVNYLADAVSALPAGIVKLTLSNPDNSVRIEGGKANDSIYVIMPMRL
jgi:DNA polymerase-3 subunit beta